MTEGGLGSAQGGRNAVLDLGGHYGAIVGTGMICTLVGAVGVARILGVRA